MKSVYPIKLVGDVLTLEYGKPLAESERDPEGGVPAYGANGVLCWSKKAFRKRQSIIVGRKGSAGEVTLTEGPFWPTDVTYFVEHDERVTDLRYLFHILKFLKLQKLAKGVKPGINRNDVYVLSAPIPALPEQQRIVAILDEAFEGIAVTVANTKKNLANASALFECYLQAVEGQQHRLGDLVEIKTGKLDANAAVDGGKYPFFTCAKEIYAIDKFAFDCEAILLAGNNAVGDFNVKHYKGKFNAYQRTYVITVNAQRRVLYRFLYFQMLRSLRKFKAQSVGVGTKFLKLGMIQDMEIALPAVGDQEHIVSKLDMILEETERLGTIYQQKLVGLEELKQSILQKAFAGDLTAQPEKALQVAFG